MRVKPALFCLVVAACGAPPTSPAEESSDTSGGEATGEDTAASTDDETGPEPLPDAGDLPPGPQPCHPFDEPCAEADEKCLPTDTDEDGDWDAWLCFPTPQTSGPLEACAQPQSEGLRLDDCEPGLLCSDVSAPDASDGWCAAICDDDNPCPSGQSCLPSPEGLWSWCRPQCDPTAEPSGCPVPELSCGLGIEPEFVCNQRITAQSVQGESCVLPTDCAYGNLCLSGAVVGPDSCGAHASCCTQVCDLMNNTCPVEAPNCIAIFSEGPHADALGFCGA